MTAQLIPEKDAQSKARKRKSTRNTDHWYPRNPQDFFDGTRDLTAEQRGFYNDIVDLIYIYGGALRMSDRVIAGLLVCHTQKWTHVKAVLIEKKKLFLTPEGWLHNERADEVLASRQAASDRRATSKLPRTYLEATSDLPPPTKANGTSKNACDNNAPGAEKPTYTRELEDRGRDRKKEKKDHRHSKRGSRLPADWTLPSDLREWAEINFSPDRAAITFEAERFKDFWTAACGSKGLKLDWAATWRNWCRNANGPPATLSRRPTASRAPPPWQADQQRRLSELRAANGSPQISEKAA